MKEYATVNLDSASDWNAYPTFSHRPQNRQDYNGWDNEKGGVLERMTRDGWIVVASAIVSQLSTDSPRVRYHFILEREVP